MFGPYRFGSWVESVFVFGCESDFVRIWNDLYDSLPVCLPRPWTTASGRPIAVICLRTSEIETAFEVANVTCVPPLKSMPRFRPFVASEPAPIATIAPEIANHR